MMSTTSFTTLVSICLILFGAIIGIARFID